MARTDYAFPFRIDPVSGQALQTPYAAHVDQMIRQVLLTAPGERADLPQFGCCASSYSRRTRRRWRRPPRYWCVRR